MNMNILKKLTISVLVLLTIFSPSLAYAANLTTGEFVNSNATLEQFSTVGWNKNCVINKFDSSLGNLEKVIFTLDGSIQVTEYKVENVQTNSVNLNSTLTSNITATLPGSTSVLSAPSVSYTRTLAAFDGTSDYAGPSGFQFPTQSNTKQVVKEIIDSNKSQFIGSGSITIPVQSDGSTTVTISSNADYRVRTEAKATCKVKYEYSRANEVSVTKRHAGSSYVQVGNEVPFILTVKNNAAYPTEGNISINDILPSSLSYVRFTGNDWSCTSSGQNVNCTTGKVLNSNESTEFTVVTKVNTGATGVLTNTVCVQNGNDAICPTSCDVSTNPTNRDCNNKGIDWVTVGVAPTSMPTSTPAPTAYVCNETKPNCKPTIFQINTTDTKATLYVNPCTDSSCKKYQFIYSAKSGGNDYSVTYDAPSNTSGAINFDINALSPATKYYVRVKCTGSCSSGDEGGEFSFTTNNKNDTCINQFYTNGSSVKGACGGDTSQVLGASTSSKKGDVLGAFSGNLAGTGFYVLSTLIVGVGILFVLFAMKRRKNYTGGYQPPVYKRISEHMDDQE